MDDGVGRTYDLVDAPAAQGALRRARRDGCGEDGEGQGGEEGEEVHVGGCVLGFESSVVYV